MRGGVLSDRNPSWGAVAEWVALGNDCWQNPGVGSVGGRVCWRVGWWLGLVGLDGAGIGWAE